jgi:hypothetical protein
MIKQIRPSLASLYINEDVIQQIRVHSFIGCDEVRDGYNWQDDRTSDFNPQCQLVMFSLQPILDPDYPKMLGAFGFI